MRSMTNTNSAAKRGRGGWSREALMPSAGNNVDFLRKPCQTVIFEREKCQLKPSTKAEVFWHGTLLRYSVCGSMPLKIGTQPTAVVGHCLRFKCRATPEVHSCTNICLDYGIAPAWSRALATWCRLAESRVHKLDLTRVFPAGT